MDCKSNESNITTEPLSSFEPECCRSLPGQQLPNMHWLESVALAVCSHTLSITVGLLLLEGYLACGLSCYRAAHEVLIARHHHVAYIFAHLFSRLPDHFTCGAALCDTRGVPNTTFANPSAYCAIQKLGEYITLFISSCLRGLLHSLVYIRCI